ncbi:hypothetical protein IFM89_009359 [Coptis chinensis]|uniref:Uncharacterized protein n=1 Tax=Coptis chinensis TaxID=261450 RepID=A0A835LR55_9MAGN|nr:hypothetical protein IFM89_009359 [Coptis chinensis]
MNKTQRITFTPYHHPTRQFSLYSIVTISTTNDKKRYISCSVGGKTVDEPVDVKQGEKVRESRKRLRIVDVKRGLDEGLDWLGKKLVVKGWVQTLRVQSSVTFLKVNDGSCLSNMQCVINSDADAYDQVESGFISTGASVWVEGVVLISHGSKQKVELNVGKVITRLVLVFPILGNNLDHVFCSRLFQVARVRNALAYATHKFF